VEGVVLGPSALAEEGGGKEKRGGHTDFPIMPMQAIAGVAVAAIIVRAVALWRGGMGGEVAGSRLRG